jgi:LPS-assembly lipoprotein
LLSNNTVGRERRTLRARYQLVDVATGRVLLDATSGSDAGIDAVSSEFATVAGEDTALENLIRIVADQIVIRLSLQLRSGKANPG